LRSNIGNTADPSDIGFEPVENRGAGQFPGVKYWSGNHTASLVPLFARGAGASSLAARVVGMDPVEGRYVDNTAVFDVMFRAMRTRGDVDGGGRADVAVYHPPTGGWYIFGTRSGFRLRHFGFDGTLPPVLPAL
jgi:hypothetical protein